MQGRGKRPGRIRDGSDNVALIDTRAGNSFSPDLAVRAIAGPPQPQQLAPVFSLPNHSPLQFYEDVAFGVRIARTATLSDPDSANFNGGSLTIVKTGATVFDQIGISTTSGLTMSGATVIYQSQPIGTVSGGVNGAPLVISLTANATPAITEMLANNITYLTTSQAPTEGLASFTITINDGTGGSAQIVATVDVVPVNDAPTLANLHADFGTYAPGGAPMLIDAGTPATASDIDGTDFWRGGLRVSITGGFAGSEDELGLAAGSGVTMSGGNLLVDGITIGSVLRDGGPNAEELWFLFDSNATHARVTQVIRAVTYWNSDSTPDNLLKTISFSLEDGGGTNNGGTNMTVANAQIAVGQPTAPPRITLGSALTADVVMNAAGTRLYESGDDGFVRVYDAGTGAILANWDVGTSLGAIDISPDGAFLIVVEREPISEIPGTSSTVAAYRIDTGTGAITPFQTVVPGEDGAFWDAAILAGGHVLFPGPFSGTQQVTPRILDPATGQFTASATTYGGTPTVAVSPDRTRIVIAESGSSAGGLYMVEVGPDDRLALIHQSSLFGVSGFNHGVVAIGPEAGYIAQHANATYLYDLTLGNRFEINANGVLYDPFNVVGLVFDPDGEFLFVLDAEGNRIQQVSLADFNVVRTITVVDDVERFWVLHDHFVTYANRLSLTGDLSRFVVETGHSIVRIDAVMPAVTLVGDGGANMLTGSIGNDVLDGAGGADIMAGGHGDDLYRVDNAGDVIGNETAHKGRDTVLASTSYALGADARIELLSTDNAAGTDAINLAGNGFDQTITGNAGNNALGGGGGADILIGGLGNDFLDGGAQADLLTGGIGDEVYIVDNAGDRIVENANEGFDIVYASASYALAEGVFVEILSTIDWSSAAVLNLDGNGQANIVYGNAGANILNGGGGADILSGFGGDDVYFTDNAADTVIEGQNQGVDTVYALVSYGLAEGSHIETLSAVDWSSAAALALTGNALANRIYGNAGANSLNGGGGADVLIGFGGSDTYYVDSAADLVIEAAGQGYDTVYASADHALTEGSHVEILSAGNWASTAALNLTGNNLSNTLYGNAGANSLNGGGGADQLTGFGGDDVYFVDNAADVATEAAGQGYDTVYASADHALAEGSHIEILSASDWSAAGALNLTGNGFSNSIYGNAGANSLNGGGGADLLTGFGGADMFAFTTALGGGNIDTIGDFVAGTDKIGLDDAIFTAIGGTLGAGAFVIGTAAADADDRILYDAATGRLFYDADGNGAGAAVQFATLAGAPALTAGDFAMI